MVKINTVQLARRNAYAWGWEDRSHIADGMSIGFLHWVSLNFNLTESTIPHGLYADKLDGKHYTAKELLEEYKKMK